MKTKWIFVVAAAALMIGAFIVFRPGGSKTAEDCGSCGGELAMAADTEAPAENVPPPDSTTVIVAYYFHTTQRCSNCYKIETYTHEAIEAGFAEAISNGKLVWRMINTDDAENEHFLKDYKLFTKSVVLADYRSGQQIRWKNLDKVWTYLGNKDAFQEYIRAEVRAYLGA